MKISIKSKVAKCEENTKSNSTQLHTLSLVLILITLCTKVQWNTGVRRKLGSHNTLQSLNPKLTTIGLVHHLL